MEKFIFSLFSYYEDDVMKEGEIPGKREGHRREHATF
jgi:hypothetical protein